MFSFQQVLQEHLRGFNDGKPVRANLQFGGKRRFVGGGDAGEVLELAGALGMAGTASPAMMRR